MSRYKAGVMQSGIFAGMSDGHIAFVIEYSKDFDARRASEAAGFEPEYGHVMRKRPDVSKALDYILAHRVQLADISAAWLLSELVDNHYIARQQGKIATSNQALNLIAKHVSVDAFAAVKVDVSSDQEIVERLKRARERLGKPIHNNTTTESFL